MSVAKVVKANLITQLIWLVVVLATYAVYYVIGFKKGLTNTTKDGFQSQRMQSLYDHYIQKEMQYGKQGK